MNDQMTVMNELPALLAPILHILIALWGLLDCFFGLRILKVTIRVMMAFFGLFIGAALAAHFSPQSVSILVAASLGGLLVGFLLGWFVYKLGVVIMAVMAGFVLVAPFQSILGPNFELVIPCCAGLAAGLLAFLILEPIVIVSTALTGAFRLVFGIAFFAGGASLIGYADGELPWRDLLVGPNLPVSILTLVVAVAGCYVQFSAEHKGRGHHKDDEE